MQWNLQPGVWPKTEFVAVTLVTGEINAGKTAWLKNRAEATGSAAWLSVKNFSGPSVSIFQGYDLLALPSGKTVPLARLSLPAENSTGWFPFKRFFFNQAAFTRAMSLFSDSPPDAAACILDEAGPLELEGRGFAPLLTRLLDRDVDLYLSVRPSLVEEIQREFGFSAFEIIRLPGC